MPKDTISFHFCNDKPTPKVKSITSKIVAAFEKNGTKVEELSYDQDGNKCFASFWPELEEDSSDIKEALTYLNSLPQKEMPYAKLELDSTGNVYYYLLDGQHLVSFDDFKELKQYSKLVSQSSIEDALFRHVDESNTALFVRLKFSKKRALSEYQTAATKFIDEKNAENYAAFKHLIDSRSYNTAKTDYPLTTVWREDFAKNNMAPEAEKELGELVKSMRDNESEVEFVERIEPRLAELRAQKPETNPLVTSELGNLKLGEVLTQCVADKNFLYLVFEHDTKFGVSPCEKGKQTWHARSNILNGEGWQILELLECLVLQEDIDKVTAKLYSPLDGSSASLYSLGDGIVLCEPWWEDEPLPPRIWPS